MHFWGRAGYLKAFTNAMGSYHMAIAVKLTAGGMRNFPQTVVC
jgi:hypothetical protein